MVMDEHIELLTERDYLVVKHNTLIQKSKYDLSLAEQKAIAYICSKIKPLDPSTSRTGLPYQLNYIFFIRDYAKVCGLTFSGRLYEDTIALFKKLMTRIISVEDYNRDIILLTWISKVYIRRGSTIEIRLNPEIAPFLFDLKENFTAYGLLNILAMKSQYSIRIYELLHSHAFKGGIILGLDYMKQMLMVDNKKTYQRFPDFRRRALDPAMEEINMYTDLQVSYEPITKGQRKVEKIKFLISKKSPSDRHISWAKSTDKIT